jgi:adenylate kinase family enzyme
VSVDRIRVVGDSGSGKTTAAAGIAERLGVPHLELDAVHWLPGWQERDPAEFRALVVRFARQPRWVIDGNYWTRLGPSLDHLVDLYLWIDLPRLRAASSVLRRTVRRGIRREELWGTNRERLSSMLHPDPEKNIVLWSLTRHGRHRERYEALAAANPDRWVRLRSRAALWEFIEALPVARIGPDG